MKLTGNTIFITGGSAGIGRRHAQALHNLGNKVIISGRRNCHLERVVALGTDADEILVDVARPLRDNAAPTSTSSSRNSTTG